MITFHAKIDGGGTAVDGCDGQLAKSEFMRPVNACSSEWRDVVGG